jgi:hypothetical protein
MIDWPKLRITNADVERGMSGSPVVTNDEAVATIIHAADYDKGVLCPNLMGAPPSWLIALESCQSSDGRP